MKSRLAVLLIMLVVAASWIIAALRAPRPLAADTPGDILRPGHSDHPTPFPTPAASLPPMTPVPTSIGEPTKYVPIEPEASPTPIDDNMPLFSSSAPFRNPSIESSTHNADSILIGTVSKIEPARWTTADGRRPPHPHSQRGVFEIYRPVWLHVEEQLSGGPIGAEILLYGFGGQVGQDSMRWDGDDLHTFAAGDRVIVWLAAPEQIGGKALRRPIDKYTLIGDTAQNIFRSLPLAEIRQRIAAGPGQR